MNINLTTLINELFYNILLNYNKQSFFTDFNIIVWLLNINFTGQRGAQRQQQINQIIKKPMIYIAYYFMNLEDTESSASRGKAM